jgi:hypothetical protein
MESLDVSLRIHLFVLDTVEHFMVYSAAFDNLLAGNLIHLRLFLLLLHNGPFYSL